MPSEIKPICGLDRTKLSEVVPLQMPFTLFVFPTTFCNFRCNYCGHSLGFQEMKERYGFAPQQMPMDTYRRILSQAKEFPGKLKLFSLTGHGEPLLNPNIAEMVAMAKEANIAERIEIISNASLLTNATAQKLIDAGLDTLRISIQGLSSQKYQEVCGYKLDFDEFIANIRFFYEHKKTTKLFVKVMNIALNPGEDELFYKTFENISDRMYIEHCRPVYDGVSYSGEARKISDRYGREHKRRDVCPLAFFMFGIFPDGDVEPCDTIYKPVVVGNVNKETMMEIWRGKKLREFQLLQLSKRRYDNPKCAVCCAPDDVSHPEDCLDDDAERLLELFNKQR
ncbi:MAG: radical SAM protein [Lentisphaerae bacterium GWF2_52_8]|nr:MAG: radical SAM protein [Lentisphaerae bacterium GWF2_52_8]